MGKPRKLLGNIRNKSTLAFAIPIAASILFAQDAPIKLNVRQVLVPVLVNDKKGHIGTNLGAADFGVTEGGAPRNIAVTINCEGNYMVRAKAGYSAPEQ